MPTYGDWIQPDDFTATMGSVFEGADVINTTTGVSVTVDGLETTADQAQVESVVNGSATSGWGGEGPTLGDLGSPVRFQVNFMGGVSGPWSTLYAAGRDMQPWPYSAHGGNANRITAAPPLPPGAIGYEFEEPQGYCTVLGASLEYTMRHYDVDTSANPDAPTDGAWSTSLIASNQGTFGGVFPGSTQLDVLNEWDGSTDAIGTTLASFPKGTHLATETHTIDVSGYLYGTSRDGFLVLVSQVEVSAVPELINPSADGGGFGIGSSFQGTPQITYTLRPPRHRFLYDDATQRRRDIPPCHLYPRSAVDNTTVYPPASSRQRSNRTNGHH